MWVGVRGSGRGVAASRCIVFGGGRGSRVRRSEGVDVWRWVCRLRLRVAVVVYSRIYLFVQFVGQYCPLFVVLLGWFLPSPILSFSVAAPFLLSTRFLFPLRGWGWCTGASSLPERLSSVYEGTDRA